jgi:hypothetical protein
MCADTRFKDRWGSANVLPWINYVLNNTTDGETGVTPNELTFGSYQFHRTRGINFLESPAAAAEFIQKLDEDLRTLRTLADKHQLQLIRDRLAPNYKHPPNFFQKGDFVLVSRLHKVKDKLDALFAGPFEVVSHTNNEVVTKDLLSNEIKPPLHSSQLKLFYGTHDQAFDMARLDQDQYVVNSIIAHRGDPFLRTTMSFLLEYADSSTSWLPWGKDVDQLAALDIYCKSRRELWALNSSAAVAKAECLRLNREKVWEVNIGDKIFINLRFVGDYKYQSYFNTLPSINHLTYLLPAFVKSYAYNAKQIIVDIPLLKRQFWLSPADARTYVHLEIQHVSDIIIDSFFLKRHPNVRV